MEVEELLARRQRKLARVNGRAPVAHINLDKAREARRQRAEAEAEAEQTWACPQGCEVTVFVNITGARCRHGSMKRKGS